MPLSGLCRYQLYTYIHLGPHKHKSLNQIFNDSGSLNDSGLFLVLRASSQVLGYMVWHHACIPFFSRLVFGDRWVPRKRKSPFILPYTCIPFASLNWYFNKHLFVPFFPSNRDRGRRSRSRLRRRSRSRGGHRRRSRSKVKEDKFKGSLSEGMKVEQESSSDDK